MPDAEGRCSRCSWWEPLTEDNYYADDGPPADWGWCAMAEADSGVPLHPESLAVAADGEDYKAALRTHGSFGCVQFKTG